MKFGLVFIGKRTVEGNTKKCYHLCSDAGATSAMGLLTAFWIVVAEGTTDFLRETAEKLKCFTPEQKEDIFSMLEKQDLADMGKGETNEI